MRSSRYAQLFLLSACLGAISLASAPAQGSQAAGGGTYAIDGMPTEFQFSESHVQCKIGHAVMPNGTSLQMLMFSTSIGSVAIAGNTVVITGTMVSIVNLRSPTGGAVTFSETVPFVTTGVDNGTPGAGVDTFSLTVIYAPGGGQANLFGTPATFAGTLTAGNVVVR
jgi:hypothetical protein